MFIFNCCVVLLLLLLLLIGVKSRKLGRLRRLVIQNRIPALAVSLIFFLGEAVGTLRLSGVLAGLSGAAVIFCLSSMGLAFAEYSQSFVPLPITESFRQKKDKGRKVFSFFLFSVILSALLILLGIFVPEFCFALFHEPDLRKGAIASLPSQNKALAFPLLLAGAGIAEESIFRLFFQSLFRCFFRCPWAAILLSSLCFALYHLTPMDTMYLVYWHFPLTQVTSVFVSGIVLGWFYQKFGFETVVLGHTLTDYLSVLLSPH